MRVILLSILKKVSIVIITVLLLALAYWQGYYHLYLKHKWKDFWSEKEMVKYAELVDANNKLPCNFIDAYKKKHLNHFNTTMYSMYLNITTSILFKDNQKKDFSTCACTKVYNILPVLRKGIEYENYIFGFGLEKFASSERCFEYFLENNEFDFGNGIKIKGVKEMSRHLYNKEISLLDANEITRLIKVVDNPLARAGADLQNLRSLAGYNW